MSPEERTNAIAALTAEQPQLLKLARYLCRDSSRAEDLAQATFLSALEHIGSWQGRGSIKNWAVQILMNKHRRQGRNRESFADEATWQQLASTAGWNCESSLKRSEDVEQVQKAILQLAEDDREILLLRDVEGIGGDDTAEMLGLTLTAMKSRLHRARLRLLGALRDVSAVPIHLMSEEAMTCMQVVECLGDYADGCLEQEAIVAIETHLKHCDKCRLFGGRYVKLLDQLPSILGPAQKEQMTAGSKISNSGT